MGESTGRWSHESYDARFGPGSKRALALAANELRFLSDDPTPEECAEFLASGRTITDAGRWAIVRFKLAKESR